MVRLNWYPCYVVNMPRLAASAVARLGMDDLGCGFVDAQRVDTRWILFIFEYPGATATQLLPSSSPKSLCRSRTSPSVPIHQFLGQKKRNTQVFFLGLGKVLDAVITRARGFPSPTKKSTPYKLVQL